LDRLAKILPPPRIHRHRYHGAFAPNAPLRPLVTAQAREDNALAVHTSIQVGPLPPSSGGLPPKPEAPAAPAPTPRHHPLPALPVDRPPGSDL
jgi:hypothetical protein